MHAPVTPQPVFAQVDPDLAQRAVAGHGMPSQDPTPAAQMPLSAQETAREARSAPMGDAPEAHGNGHPEVPHQKP